jgi:hypothetical protein
LIDLPIAEKVERFLSDVFGGRHRVRRVIDHSNHTVVIPHGSLATFDDDRLTRVVLSAHQLGLRAEVDNHGMRGLKILLHNRTARTGRLWERHQTIDEAIVKFTLSVWTPS